MKKTLLITMIGLMSACSMFAQSASLSISGPSSASKFSRTLTFAERVAYQYAIEEVYWRHRIWPKENPASKPSLDAVMSATQIERKVEDCLRNSQLLADQWQRPITAEQLQAEMERMARQTQQPEVLRELFEALENDPSVIAECLARPVLAERLFADLSHDNSERFALSGTQAAPSITTSGNSTYNLPEISDSCTDDNWTTTSITNAPTGRQFPTAIWTGTEMIVWGGGTPSSPVNTGGRYNLATDSWTATTTTNAPSARSTHSALWTGTEMIIWAGNGLNTGGRYNPNSDSWTATTTTNAPSERGSHTAVWTGTEMIVWGGHFYDGSGINGNHELNTGGRYDPSTDSWTATTTANAPTGRYGHTAAWTGSEMIVLGGTYGSNTTTSRLNSGGRYNPATDSWTDTSNTNAPDGGFGQTAVWTGSEMIVWGGYKSGKYFRTGGRYNPSIDTWTATSIANAPLGREYHTAVWTGTEMIVWGGYFFQGGDQYQNTGGRYDPASDKWTATRTATAPTGRAYHAIVWTGREMIVWGGYPGGTTFLNSGGRYCAQPSMPIVQSNVNGNGTVNASTLR